MKKNYPTIIYLLFMLICFSCASSADLETGELSPAEYFQKANEAADTKNFQLAIKYYQAFKKRFPDDIERNLWAEYEIAFAHYKMGELENAIELFNQLIAKYDDANAAAGYPSAPKALAEKVKAGITGPDTELSSG